MIGSYSEALSVTLLAFVSSACIGLAELLSLRSSRPPWFRGLVVPAGLLAIAAVYGLRMDSSFGFGMGVLPSLLRILLFVVQRWHDSVSQWFQTAVRCRPLWAVGFLLVGPALAGWWAHYYDRANSAPEADNFEEPFHDREFVASIFQSNAPADRLETDCGLVVPLYTPSIDLEVIRQLRDREKQIVSGWNGVLIRTGPVDMRYNCVGWVFADGLGWLANPEEILSDNGYQKVSEPAIGDVVAYWKSEKINHVGIVRLLQGNRVIVESKWGPYGRFLHYAEDQPFSHEFSYYRSNRPNHGLRRVTSPDGPTESASVEMPLLSDQK